MSRSERTLMRVGRSPAVLAEAAAGVGVALGVERVDLALQRLEVVEALVDAGEPDVGDLVELAELLHRERADARRRDLGRALRAELSLDLVGGLLGGVVGDRPAGQRLAESRRELLAIELLAGAVALDDHEPGGFDALVGREPGRAGRALAPAADRGRI